MITPAKFKRLMVGFSSYANSLKLLDTSHPPARSSQITCLDGMRFLSMTWVVLGHGFGFTQTIVYSSNYNYVTNEVKKDIIFFTFLQTSE